MITHGKSQAIQLFKVTAGGWFTNMCLPASNRSYYIEMLTSGWVFLGPACCNCFDCSAAGTGIISPRQCSQKDAASQFASRVLQVRVPLGIKKHTSNSTKGGGNMAYIYSPSYHLLTIADIAHVLNASHSITSRISCLALAFQQPGSPADSSMGLGRRHVGPSLGRGMKAPELQMCHVQCPCQVLPPRQ